MFFVHLAYLVASFVGMGLVALLAKEVTETVLAPEFLLQGEYIETEEASASTTLPFEAASWQVDHRAARPVIVIRHPIVVPVLVRMERTSRGQVRLRDINTGRFVSRSTCYIVVEERTAPLATNLMVA